MRELDRRATLCLFFLQPPSLLGPHLQVRAFHNDPLYRRRPSEVSSSSLDSVMVRKSFQSSNKDGENDSDSSSQFSVSFGEKNPCGQRIRVKSGNEKFKIGILADIQYAPIPDGHSFSGVLRYYRHALDVARHAAQHFEYDGAEIVLNLGDIIDGKCQTIGEHGGDPPPEGVDPGLNAMEDVLEALSAYRQGPIIHTYGNHELYNLGREIIGKKLNIPFTRESCGDLVGYHTYVHQDMRFIVIDSYDIAKMGRCTETSQKYKQACNVLARENPNFPHNDNSSDGIKNELDRRFVAFNGGVGIKQLQWIRETLQHARENKEKVIVLSHQPILPGSSSSICLVWNYDEVLQILREYQDVIVASFAGHAHSGGYKRDEESGIHFRTIEAVLESPAPQKTYGIIEVHNDCLVFQGYGRCGSAVYDFDHLGMPQKVASEVAKHPEHPETTFIYDDAPKVDS